MARHIAGKGIYRIAYVAFAPRESEEELMHLLEAQGYHSFLDNFIFWGASHYQ